MNQNKTHSRFSELEKEKDKFINARITTPQTYDEIKSKGQATILKIASKGIVEKLLKRCEYYKAIINKKTDTIKNKNELIDLLAKRLVQHEPELFKGEFKEIGDQVEETRKEEVKTGLDEQGKPELSNKEKEQVEADNKQLQEDLDEGETEIDREPEPEREPGMEKCKHCGTEYEEGEGHDCPGDNDDGEDLCGGDGPDNDDLEDDPDTTDEDKDTEGNIEE